MIEIHHYWLVVYIVLTWLTCSGLVWMTLQVRKVTRLNIALSHALHECTGVVSAIAARGNLLCDDCHQPIAPMTPTVIEEQEAGWSIAHDKCP